MSFHSCVIFHFGDACLPGAVGAAIEGIVALDTVSDDLATAVITDGREFVYCTFETVERMTRAGCYDLER